MDLKDEIREIINLIKNIETKNVLEAIKNIAHLLKSKGFRRRLLLGLLKPLMPIIIILIINTALFSAFNSVAEKLNDLKGNLTTFTTSAWKWLTNDYWIKMDDPIDIVRQEYNSDTGENEEVTKQQTLVDSYMEELERMGLSAKDLRLLGDADYTSENPLEDSDNKDLVQKYLKEFIRADIISQEIHRRRTGLLNSEKLVNPNNENEIDGGVFLYRTKNELTSNTNLEKEKMQYKEYAEFEKMVNDNDSEATKYYSVNQETGMLAIAQSTTTIVEQKVDDGGWTQTDKQVQITLKECDYKAAISKYTLPFEFLVKLCQVTQNPEFVYRVALMARSTNIKLVVLNEITKNVSTVEETTTTTTLQNIGSDDASTASEISSTDSVTSTRTTVIEENPTVATEEIEDSWIYKGKKLYTKTYNAPNEIVSGPVEDTNYVKPARLTDTGMVTVVSPGYTQLLTNTTSTAKLKIYQGSYVSKKSTKTITSTESNSYDSGITENEEIKSDDFLGLLRNQDGIAVDVQSFKNGVREKFKKEGKNVEYIIPNTTIYEMPLNKLTSGADMLFYILRQNSKTAPQEQLMRYLLQFPDGKDYGVTEEELLDLFRMENPGEASKGGGLLWWPIEEGANIRISSYFGHRESPGGIGSTNHQGIDIAVAQGTKIIASADGVVEISKNSDSAGLYIRIDHGNGLKTVYMHNSSLLVQVGQVVKKGDVIALSGNTGNSTGPHLHFGVMLNGQYVDPMNYVSPDNPRPEVGDYSNAVPVDDMDLLCAIVASECATSYEGSLAVISCVLNRCDQNWGNHGTDPISQITANYQFSYGIPEYKNAHKRYLNGRAPEHTKQAVNDALAGRARNHSYTSFRTDSAQARRNHPNGKEIGGNWFFN